MEKTKETAENSLFMPKDVKYDVFISYSRRDYLDENKKPREDSPVWLLWKYLEKHDIKCWIDIEGIYAGGQFAGLIADAIDESKVMIFVSSEYSNSSAWTIGEVLTAHDEGKPIIPFRIDDTPYSKKFSIILRPLDYIDWSPDSEESFASVLKSVEAEKKLYDEKLAEQLAESERKELEKKKTEIREHISQTVRDYMAQAVKLRNLFDDIAKSHLALGEKHKICPVCGNSISVGSRFCKHCGWTFVPPFAISRGADQLPSGDPELIDLMQSIWQKNQSAENTIKNLSSKIDLLSGEKTKLENDVKLLGDDNRKYNDTEKLLRERINELEVMLKSVQNSYPSTDPSSSYNGHEYVDLGLPSGTLWATCNVGASKPSEYGDYFAWGETKPKDHYNSYNSVFNGNKLKKSDDAASVNWGGEWRMPARREWEELYKNCDSEWTTEDGKAGRKFKSRKNGNSIFLPAAGWCGDTDSSNYEGRDGYYWSSSRLTDGSSRAFYCHFASDVVFPSYWGTRYYGLSVRPLLPFSNVISHKR